MKKIIFLLLVISQIALAQSAPKFEAEVLKNPNKGGKDTREVNAVMIFEKGSVVIKSRRKNEIFKEFKYSEIKNVEHSYSKSPLLSNSTKSVVWAVLLNNPFTLMREEKHWLTILTENDFVVLKIENDNFRLLRMEFAVRNFDVININEDR